MAMWPEWKIKVVFMSICVPECLLHPSAVSNKPGYFRAWVCFFIEEQTPECERNVLSKQCQRPQLCLKWDSRPEESFHTCRQKKSVDNSVSVSARVRACPLPSPPQLPGHSVGWFFRCWHTHTLKPSKANCFTRISSFFVAVLKPWMYYSHRWGSVYTD